MTGGASRTYQDAMTARTLIAVELAPYIGVSRKTLYNMINDKRFSVEPIPGTKPRRWYIEDVDAWLAGRVPLLSAVGL